MSANSKSEQGAYRKIYLQGKYGEGLYALVDEEEYEELSKYRWNANQCGYAIRSTRKNGVPSGVLMHRQILGVPAGLVTDHINGNRLDNRRINLRIATRAENNRNTPSQKGSTSKYKGVMWDAKKSKWLARLRGGHLGYFESQKEAAKVYDYFANRKYGEYAYLNFPNELLSHYEKPKVQSNNTSGYVGVSWSRDKQKWHAYIRGVDGKRITLGRFRSKHEAARAYNLKAKELYGMSAKLNEVIDEEGDCDGRV
ncbi:MAG: HNH endonuclease [Bacillota bacterium]